MDDETLIKMSYITISDYRYRAVKSLENQFKTPSKIADEIGIRRNHISKVLSELKKIGVAECINEEAHKGRLYRLTPEGEKIVKKLDDVKKTSM